MAGKPKSKRSLAQWMRLWHKWVGVAGVVMLTIFAVTGIYLNHKDFWNGALGLEKPKKELKSGGKSNFAVTTTNALHVAPVTFSTALATARGHWGDVPLDKVELKHEKGAYVYKIETGEPKRSLWLSATTGEVVRNMDESKGGYSTAKFLSDLHHLNFGMGWRLAADFFAVSLLLLNLTGMWMWIRHEITARNAKKVAAAKLQERGARPNPKISEPAIVAATATE